MMDWLPGGMLNFSGACCSPLSRQSPHVDGLAARGNFSSLSLVGHLPPFLLNPW